MAEEVKSILTSLRQGPSSDREAQKLRERLAELEHIAEERERERRQLEKSLQVGLVCLPIWILLRYLESLSQHTTIHLLTVIPRQTDQNFCAFIN